MMNLAGVDVSRETFEKLEAFEALVKKWTVRINLISANSVDDIWDRHIRDSAQIFALAPQFRHWADLGSGGGFPGIVVAVLAQQSPGESKVTLIESDQRKAVFLRTAIRELGLNAKVITDRIETAAPQSCDSLSARALADVNTLLFYAERHLAPTGTALLMKGASWEKECEEARANWSFSCEPFESHTNPNAAILKIKDIARV